MTLDAGSRQARTVYIVDDDSALLHALAFEMTTQGYTVRTFSSAEGLIDDDDIPEDACLIIDQRLPRADGLCLIELLRARGVGTPAILITSNPGQTLSARAHSIGVRIVEKPLLQDDLSIAVREALNL